MNPDTIRSQRFLLVRRGYDPEAVLAFLDEVADTLAAAQASDVEPSESAVEVADARRLVDEARTRAATHRLRAQRDIEALERTARSRRARLVAEVEELATARDQLSDDLDRAVDVVDRVVQWVRRTDPAATPSGPVADVGAPDAAGTDAAGTDAGSSGAGAVDPPDRPAVDEDDPDHGDKPRPDVEVPGEARAPADADAEDLADVVPGGAVPDDAALHDAMDRDAVDRDAVDHDAVDHDPDPDRDADLDGGDAGHGTGEEVDPVAQATVADVVEDATEPAPDEVHTAPADPATAAVRAALRDVQDEVLGNLRDQPRAGVEAWVPASGTLLALDDAATEAAARAFHDGWATAGDDDPTGDGTGSAAARDALEEVRGAGALAGLGIADDLRVAIRASLQRGVDAGDATPQLVERLAEVHREARQTRLDPAVADVLGSAHHHGMVRRWAHDGVGAVRWVLGEERRCPGRRCRANATDGVVEPGAPFAWGELVPPAHPGCTCTLEPGDAPGADADGDAGG